ncbi:hypothetical protein SAMN05421578_1216 [Paenibacillus macquariensis]|uniref:Uncharacterized protein n=1 Tax=Paenibacillus macquariensis TaxID=948756 RepID=A0ABY1KF71_9BACL|nr:hypothetical protein SAMN05421578_1216 [Paenibacillus macquariensis]
MLISILLNFVLLVCIINQNFNMFGSKDTIATTYSSFYDSVRKLDGTLDQIDDSTEEMKIIENMYISKVCSKVQ